MRLFFKLVDLWGLNEQQGRALLGEPARTTFYRWRKGTIGTIPLDTLFRLGDIVGIYIGLRTLFPEAARGYAWLKRPNAAFGGTPALDIMTSGHPNGLNRVRHTIAAALNGW